ncbi:hypothetical protein THAOC_18402, partial [Thalassiosira oceanica]
SKPHLALKLFGFYCVQTWKPYAGEASRSEGQGESGEAGEAGPQSILAGQAEAEAEGSQETSCRCLFCTQSVRSAGRSGEIEGCESAAAHFYSRSRPNLLYHFPLVLLLSCAVASVKDEWCLERGFDPSSLSCDTCDLLAQSTTLARLSKEQGVDLDSECRACCAVYRANPLLRPDASLKGKYRHALLTYDASALTSLKLDLDDSMMEFAFFGMGGFGGAVPKLMFFEQGKSGGYSEEDEDEASEVIPLRGWKREDLKDMLTTLL